MLDKKRLTDIAKNCAIVILSVSAGFLIFRAAFSGQADVIDRVKAVFGAGSVSGTAETVESENSFSVSEPVFILVTEDSGSHYAVKYDNESRAKLIAQFSSYLGEALGTSDVPEEITDARFKSALFGSGVFFDYLNPQPVSVIASSLGTDVPDSLASKTARRFYLGNDGGNIVLYFISEPDGGAYACGTSLSFDSLETKITACPVGTANYAFELGPSCENLDPYFILSHESDTLQELTATNPIGEDFDGIGMLEYFGMNKKVAQEYPESDKSEAYVEGNGTLRIESGGKILFSTTGSSSGISISGGTSDLTVNDCVSACADIVKNVLGPLCGSASTGLVGVSDVSDPYNCTVSFGYFADGIPIELPGGANAAVFWINEGTITKAELYCRSYAFSGGSVIALPEKQASVIAGIKGGEPVLIYEDKADSVSCTWIYN